MALVPILLLKKVKWITLFYFVFGKIKCRSAVKIKKVNVYIALTLRRSFLRSAVKRLFVFCIVIMFIFVALIKEMAISQNILFN